MRAIWTLVVAAFLVGGSVLAWLAYQDTKARDEKRDEEHVAATEQQREADRARYEAATAIKVRASELSKAFDTNEVDADAKYSRHKVTVDGWTKRVWKSSDGVVLLELRGPDFGSDIQCAYVGDTGYLSKIRPGMRVNMTGIVTGRHALLGVVVANCEVNEYWE